MNSRLNLSNIKECEESWDSMTNCGDYRKCKTCNQDIYDFRGLTNWEIALIHGNSKTKVCGIYDENISKDSINKIKRNKSLIIAGLFGLITSNSSANTISSVPNEITEFQLNSKDLNSTRKQNCNQNSQTNNTDSLKIVEGILVDETKNPLIGVNIILDGTTKGAITDINGRFSLDLTEEFNANDSVNLILSYIGYGRKEQVITKYDFLKTKRLSLNIVLDQQIEMSAFIVKRLPLHKRILNSIKGIFKN